jgi:rubrerythrin
MSAKQSAQTMADGLKQAMLAEQEGHHFYQMASRATDDPQGRQVFERLALEELEHFEFLKAQLGAVLKNGAPDASLKLGPPTTLTGENPIFSDALRARIGQAHYEMTALAVGAQLELAAERFYREAAAAAEDAVVRGFYEELAAWESGHYHALLAQQESLKEDYWSQGGFAPF